MERYLLCDGVHHQTLVRAPHRSFVRLFGNNCGGLPFPVRGATCRWLGGSLPRSIHYRCSCCPLFASPFPTMRWTGGESPTTSGATLEATMPNLWRLPTGYLGHDLVLPGRNRREEMMKSHLVIAPCLVILGFAVAVARKEFNRCWYAFLVWAPRPFLGNVWDCANRQSILRPDVTVARLLPGLLFHREHLECAG